MTPRKPWYSHLTVDHLIKYFTLAAFITGMITGIGRVIAVPYVKEQIAVSIEDNNQKFLRVIDDKYADKNQLLKEIYEMQKETNMRISIINQDVANIKGKLSR